MNRFELVKAGMDLDAVAERVSGYARAGWQSISADDIERLKILGIALRRKTPGYFMIRIRVPAGILSAAQAKAVAVVSRRFGRGKIDLTARGQAQIRWLRIGNIPQVVDALGAVGLIATQTLMDSVRGIIGCPLAGLTDHALLDATPVIRACDAAFAGDRELVNLPRKLNIAITGCTRQCCHAPWQDIALTPATRDAGGQGPARGFNVMVGGKLSGGDFHPARPLDLFVTPDQVAPVLRAIITTYRDHGLRESRARSRLVHLILKMGMRWMRDQVEQRTGQRFPSAGVDARGADDCNELGLIRSADGTTTSVGLSVPMGRITGDQLERAGELAGRFGDGTLRLTADQNLLIPRIEADALDQVLADPLLATLPHRPHPAAAGTISCTGSSQCSMAVIDSKRHAARLADELAERLPDCRRLRIHWSACRAGCGRHAIADIGLVGRKTMRDGQLVEAADVYVAGSAGSDAAAGIKVLDAVPCDVLADAIEPFVRYGAFEAVRRQIGRAAASSARCTVGPNANAHGVEPLSVQTVSIHGREAVAV